MPRLQDIERFKKDLSKLAHEPEVLAQWGEKPADVPAPEGANDDAALAAAKAGRKPAHPVPKPKTAPASDVPGDELPPDFETLLADLPLDQEEEPAPADKAAEKPEETEPSPAEAVDEAEELSDDLGAFGEEPAPAQPEDTASDLPLSGSDASSVPGVSGEQQEGPAEDSFSIPDFDTAMDLDSGKEEAAPEAAPAETAAPASSEAAPEAGNLPEDSGTFDLGDLGDLGGGASLEPDHSGSTAAPDLPDFDASGLDIPPATADAGTELPAEAAPDKGAPAAPETAAEAAPEDEFSIPDLNGFDLDEEPAGSSQKQEGASEAPANPGGQTGGLDEPAIPDFGATPDFGAADTSASQPSAETSTPESPGSGSLDLGGESNDSFDNFSFGSTGGAGSTDFDKELAALGTETTPASNFNLGKEWEDGFDIPGAESTPARTTRSAPRKAAPKAEEKAREVSLSDAQFDRLQDRLLALPLNLRVAIEQIIGQEKGDENQRSKLVWMLVERASLKEIAAAAGKILDKRISIPEGFEKRSGADFETEKSSFRYVFVHTVLPIARTVLLALIAAGALIFLGYEYVYKPLSANSLYRQGYSLIGEDRYDEANSDFNKASAIKDYKNWYYQYARAFARKRQYARAEDKYKALLRRYPKEAAGALEWAQLERDIGKYADAVKVLRNYILNYDYFNKDALMLEGYTYLDWADQDKARYDDARRSFSALLNHYGEKDEFLEGMLLYYIRTGNFKGVKTLFTHFMEKTPPYPRATTLAELAGFLLDRGTLEGVHPVLSAAIAKDQKEPEVHYQFSRYYHKIEDSSNELKALNSAIKHFEEKPVLTDRQFPLYLDSLIWRGNCHRAQKEYISAEEDYRHAAEKYDDALKNPAFKPSARFAEAFAGLAEVAFWQRNDLANALIYYERAALDGYDTPDTRYRRGFINYAGGDYKSALEQFYMAGRDGGESPYLLYSFGNALYQRGDYHAAESYYKRTVDRMQFELQNISSPEPQLKASQGEIVTLLMEAQNNLGVTEYRVANRSGDASLRAEGMFAFSESMRLYDSLQRDQTTLERPQSKAPAYINTDAILHPVRGQDLVIYNEIPRDMTFPSKTGLPK